MPDRLALKVNQLDVNYKDFQALWNVSFEVKKGEIVSIIGANGAGKSTPFKLDCRAPGAVSRNN